MRITNIQKKELSDHFRKLKLNIFDFESTGQYEEFKIKFKYDYFSFVIIKQKPNIYLIEYYSVDNKNGISAAVSWIDLLKHFYYWTKSLSAEINSPSGWESFENTCFLNDEYEELDKTFTEQEKYQTKKNVKSLREKVKSLDLSPELLLIIDLKLDVLSSKVDELSKFDWRSLFIGTFASLIMTFAIPPEASGMLWEHIKNTFNNLKITA